MYRRPKFLEVLLKIREEMAREADYDVDFFAEMVRSGLEPATDVRHVLSEPREVGENGMKGKAKIQKGREPSKKRSSSPKT
jgi:hypothetical protein